MYCRGRTLRSLLSLNLACHATNKYNPLFSFSVPIKHIHHIGSSVFSGTNESEDHIALQIQILLRGHSQLPVEDIEKRLAECNLSLSEDLILEVLIRHRNDWKPAYVFFNWISKVNSSVGLSLTTTIYNEILDILGLNKRFEELLHVLDEMSRRKHFISDRTYGIVLNRFSAARRVEEAVEFFHKIEPYFGLKCDLAAFQTLLLSLCRYKNVEAAELLFHNLKNKFNDDIKTWNIILNGWCVLGSLPDVKRVWRDIFSSTCKPDKYTYGIFINALSKSGKISTATKLLRALWEKECTPDVTICNTVIDGLCFKKRIPEALEIFNVMKERNCPPNVATYNSLVKHLCKIRRMEKVDELLSEMEARGEGCLPNALTYGYLMKAAKCPKEVDMIVERMVKSGCKLQGDTYNMMLRLFMEWREEERVMNVWNEMEKAGLGPDKRSYTVLIQGLYDKGMMLRALEYYNEMTGKGMIAEPSTMILVDKMNSKLKETEELRGDGTR